jgi:DNA replication and repair protein RecF
MWLERLAGRGWRNLADFDLDVDARFVVAAGENAQGKTNLLEAPWFVACLKPLRGSGTRGLVRFGEANASLGARLRGADGLSHQLRVDLGEARKLTLDAHKSPSLADWFSTVRAIASTPQDASIILGEPAYRRAWVDRAAFTLSPTHLAVVQQHRQLLAQKAALLRHHGPPDTAVLDVLDDQLAAVGARLVDRRAELLEALAPHLTRMHRAIAPGSEVLALRYRSVVPPGSGPAALRERLGASRRDELRRRMALVGPQTDDVEWLLDGHPARQFASRGQVRTLVLASKLAELAAATERGSPPLFLLDDLSTELDAARARRLVALLVELRPQVLVTTTDPSHLGDLPASDARFFRVERGVVDVAEGPGAR